MKLGKPFARGRTSEIYNWKENQVLKLFEKWIHEDSVKSEFENSKIVYEANLNVPNALELIEIDGKSGIVYERITGSSMLDEMKSHPRNQKIYAKQMAVLHLSLHKIEISGFPSKTEQLFHSISRVQLSKDKKKDIRDILDNLPNGNHLCHGDFHPDNIMLTAENPYIIDWQNAARGHPLSDVARTVLLLTIGVPPSNLVLRLMIRLFRSRFLKHYLQFYFYESKQDKDLLDRWMIPIAAARIDEGIKGEKKQLTKMISDGLNKLNN